MDYGVNGTRKKFNGTKINGEFKKKNDTINYFMMDLKISMVPIQLLNILYFRQCFFDIYVQNST